MVRGADISIAAAPAAVPRLAPEDVSGGVGVDRQDHWRSIDNSVNAVSFGFVATASLISMFLVMAIFERFLRARSPDAGDGGSRNPDGDEANTRKLDYPSPKMTVYYPREVAVLMPGETTPSFIAHTVPAPYPAEHASQTVLYHGMFLGPTSNQMPR